MAGRGAAPAGGLASRHSGGIGAPPGTIRSPCQELADDLRSTPNACPSPPAVMRGLLAKEGDAGLVWRKRGPVPENAAAGAPRGARRVLPRTRKP